MPENRRYAGGLIGILCQIIGIKLLINYSVSGMVFDIKTFNKILLSFFLCVLYPFSFFF
jgi:hypothetical protein